MSITRISPDEALAKMKEGYTYLDVRSEVEFAEGHPTGAYNVPLLHQGPGGMTPNAEFLTVMLKVFPKNTALVLGCRSGGRSMRAAEMLIQAGYTNVLEQRAGWDGARTPFGQITEPGWSRCNLPVETGDSPGRNYGELKTR
jgi:rhodanese-related sulfurtransferase